MQVLINGESRQIESESLSIYQLLEVEKVQSPEMVSVQMNGKVLDRSSYKEATLSEGDEVDFLYFMGGG